MKKVYACWLSLLTAGASMAQFPVTFSVDMTGQTVSPNGVHIAGNFQDVNYDGTFENPSLVNWSPSTYQLTDDDMDMVYSVTLDLVADDRYEFKFINGNDWPFEEAIPAACQVGNGNSNRFIAISGETDYLICWESCAPCGMKTVRFRVDMSLAPDGVNPAGVSVAGDFQGWSPGATLLADADGNLIFERAINVGTASSIEFKYINGDDWVFAESVPAECGFGPNSNRQVNLTETNTVLTAWCFGGCSTCLQPTQVTFKVDMTNETVGANGVHVAGNFQGWNPGSPDHELTDGDGDNIYEVTVPIQPGSIQYKFVNGNAWGGDESVPAACNVGGNRGATIAGETMELYFCFEQCSSECVVNPDPAAITFRVNMSEATVAPEGVFFISGATVPAWQDGATQMTDDNADGVYECTVTISGPADIQYKFVNGDVSVSTNEENAGLEACGIANGIGGFNRTHVRSGEPEALSIVCFNECADCEVSVSELADVVNQVNVFPVPAQDVLSVRFNSNVYQNITLRVVNLTGQVVLTQNAGTVKPGAHTIPMNVSNLASGVYFLEIGNETANQVVRISVR
jgi:hypothetical protein